jgi:excisionase family DNA binding protein
VSGEDLIGKILADGKLALRVSKAAALVDLKKTAFYELIARRKIRAIRIGAELRVPVAELLRLISEGTGE